MSVNKNTSFKSDHRSINESSRMSQKLISVDRGNGHCCHRPSSNWETKNEKNIENRLHEVTYWANVTLKGGVFYSEQIYHIIGKITRRVIKTLKTRHLYQGQGRPYP